MKRFIPRTCYQKLPLTAPRIEWAEESGRKLANSIKYWQRQASYTWEPVIFKNRLGCDWILKISKPPPLVKWGYRYGDAVHNIRSILDNAVYELAVSHGITRGLAQLEFPISDSEKSWERKKQRVAVLPEQLVNCIEKLQPFNLTNQNLKLHLLALKRLNNTDKHRTPIVSIAVVEQVEATAEAEPMRGEHIQNWHWNISIQSTEFKDGVTTLRIDSQERIGKIKGEYLGKIRLLVTDLEGNRYGLTESLAWMLDSATKIAEHLATDEEE